MSCTLTHFIQEDLATHTIPSPPFIDSDLDHDKSPDLSDWEYDTDDYWDHNDLSKRKHHNAGENTNKINNGPKNKRRKLDSKEYIPGFSLEGEGSNTAALTVIWKTKRDQLIPPEEPIVKAGQGEKVALLKDWRERFKSQPNRAASWPESNLINRRGSQRATAVIISNGSPEPYQSTTLPPTTLEKTIGIPSRARVFPYTPEHKQPEVNGTILHTPAPELISGDSHSARLTRNTTTTGKKRKIEELPNHQEDEPPTPKKRPRTPKKETTYDPQTPKHPLANRTNSSIPASGKRKADDLADQSTISPRKRTQTTKTREVEARASEESGSPTGRTTRGSK